MITTTLHEKRARHAEQILLLKGMCLGVPCAECPIRPYDPETNTPTPGQIVDCLPDEDPLSYSAPTEKGRAYRMDRVRAWLQTHPHKQTRSLLCH